MGWNVGLVARLDSCFRLAVVLDSHILTDCCIDLMNGSI